MRLSWIEVTDYRSYEALRFEPDPGINVLVGDNGSGKTSLLEAVGYLASLASFRRAPDASLVRSGSTGAVIRGEFSQQAPGSRLQAPAGEEAPGSRLQAPAGEQASGIRHQAPAGEEASGIRHQAPAGGRQDKIGGETLVEIELPAGGRRRVLLNGKPATSRAAVAATVALIAFLPDDLDLVKRGPAYRRVYLDDLAAQLWPAAGIEQAEYERVLRQRNALLRRDGRMADPTTLDVLDETLAAHGGAVLARRLATVQLITPSVERLYAELGETPARVSFRYAASGLGDSLGLASAEDFTALLAVAVAESRRADLERRTTSVGPHRDEIEIDLDDRDARTRASQVEQRSVALGLRIAAYRVLAERRGTPPVLLLDDVFSELDARRSARLVERLPEGQMFVTSARSEEVPVVGKRWRVAAGAVETA